MPTTIAIGVDDLSAPTATLLASAGDSRHTVDADGCNRYGNSYEPEPGVVTFGSCTSSSISEEAYAAAARLHGWLATLDERFLDRAVDDLYDRVRAELTANIAMTMANRIDVVITPSGTDAELVPLVVARAGGRPVTNILVGPAEAGSGTARAAAGRHFDTVTPAGSTVVPGDPIDTDLASAVETVYVSIRTADGTPRDEAAVDADVSDAVRAALADGRTALVHVIAHSKTGVHAPTLDVADRLRSADPDRVHVVIDAAQGRFSRRGLGESLAAGCMVMTTGSKFFGGPPFAGAVLIPRTGRPRIDRFPPGCSEYLTPAMLPRGWSSARESLVPRRNIGVLLRWWAALAEIRDYYSVPAQLRFDVLQRFQAAVPDAVDRHPRLGLRTIPSPLSGGAAHRVLESNTTVFPFTCARSDGSTFGADDLRRVQRLMRAPLEPAGGFADLTADVRAFRVELGQPVAITRGDDPTVVLRLALGARQIIRTCVVPTTGKTFDERLAALEADVERTFTKLDAVLAHLETAAR